MQNEEKKINKKDKKPKSKLRKAVDWIFSIVTGVFLVCLLGVQINALITKDQNHGVPSYFGYSYMYVLTNSMESDNPADRPIAKGSAVFTEKVDPRSIKPEDDITFMYNLDGLEEDTHDGRMQPFTHRVESVKIIEVDDGNGGKKEVVQFVAHGINKKSENFDPSQKQIFTEDRLIGKVVWSSKAVGSMIEFLSSWQGLLVILLIPCGYLIIVSAFDIFKALKTEEDVDTNNKEKGKDDSSNSSANLSADDKERLKKELLNELLNKKEGDK